MPSSSLTAFLRQRWLSPATALATLLAISILTEHRGPIEDHRKPEDIRRIQRRVRRQRAKVVVMGNSLVGQGVQRELLSGLLGVPVYRLWRNSMRSAWWYLALKNVVAPVGADVVVICFRNTVLTDPARGVDGKHKLGIGQLATEDEPLLHSLAYYAHLDELQLVLTRYWSLFQRRDRARQKFERKVKRNVARRLFDSDWDDKRVDKAIGRVLADENMNADLITLAQAAHEEPTAPEAYDFHRRVQASFLPHIIQVARQNDIRLVFVRYRTRRNAAEDEGAHHKKLGPHPQPDLLGEYIDDLAAYLEHQGATLVDFTDTPDLKLRHYREHDHLRDSGRDIFTRLLAEALSPHANID